MLYDEVRINVEGGTGGNGAVAFRREKYVPLGGPSGGDGGRGGSIILIADPNYQTLMDFKYRRHYRAERGDHGRSKTQNGRQAEDLILKVPLGTVVYEEEGALLGDLVEPGQQLVVAQGGRGGRGNCHYTSSRYQVPRVAEKGEPGENRWLRLELKLMADVGLVGLPNAGKSTLLSRISAATPKVADYPFTTLEPQLGVVVTGEGRGFVVADLPGLIAGAHLGAGLGHDFLRHVERNRLLVQVIDVAGTEGRDPVEDYHTIEAELRQYNSELLQLPRLILANKCELTDADKGIQRLREELPGFQVMAVSAVTGQGISELLFTIEKLLQNLPDRPMAPVMPEAQLQVKRIEPDFIVEREGDSYVVKGSKLLRRIAMTDLDNEDALKRFQFALRRSGVEKALKKQGIKTGDTVRIGEMEFEYME